MIEKMSEFAVDIIAGFFLGFGFVAFWLIIVFCL